MSALSTRDRIEICRALNSYVTLDGSTTRGAGASMVPTAKSPSLIAAASHAFSHRGELHSGERWYVVRALAKREHGAAAQLAGQGFRVFLPKVSRNVCHARKTKAVHAPAFPGYLFVALDLRRDRWRSINGTFGVMSLIMAEERPVPVPRGVVEAIINYVDESGICRFDRDLMEGQAIRVTSGPLAEAVGELVRLDKGGRVRVLLEIMGGRVLATIERSSLVAA